jgi:hypothetical protein
MPSGDGSYMDICWTKLERNLKPSVLMTERTSLLELMAKIYAESIIYRRVRFWNERAGFILAEKSLWTSSFEIKPLSIIARQGWIGRAVPSLR